MYLRRQLQDDSQPCVDAGVDPTLTTSYCGPSTRPPAVPQASRPTKQGGRALKNASTSDRCSFRRNTVLPAASTPCSWKTRLAISKPTVVISIVDGSFSSLHSTARAWHIDAVRGRPPHQILYLQRLRFPSRPNAHRR